MGGRMRRSSVTGNCAEGQQPAGLPQRDALPPREPPASWSGATAHRLPAGILPRLTPAAPARPPPPRPILRSAQQGEHYRCPGTAPAADRKGKVYLTGIYSVRANSLKY